MMGAERWSRGWRWLAAGLIAAPAVAAAEAADGDGRALIAAVRGQDVEASRTLIDRGADVDAVQPDGATALHWAAYHDAVELVDLLIGAGAAVDAANDYGVTPLGLACDNAATATVARLLAAGADPNRARGTGETPVMTCARTGSAEAVRELLAHGADPSAVEPWHGQTALMWAAGGGHADAARALIEHGADVEARSKGGFTALLIAAREDDPALVGDLVAAGADVERGGARRHHAAARRGGARPRRARDGAARARGGPERRRPRLHRPALGGGVVAHRADRPPAGHRHRRRPWSGARSTACAPASWPSSTRCWPTGPTPTSGSAATRPSSASRASASG